MVCSWIKKSFRSSGGASSHDNHTGHHLLTVGTGACSVSLPKLSHLLFMLSSINLSKSEPLNSSQHTINRVLLSYSLSPIDSSEHNHGRWSACWEVHRGEEHRQEDTVPREEDQRRGRRWIQRWEEKGRTRLL